MKDTMLKERLVSKQDLTLYKVTDDPDDVLRIIKKFL